MRNTIKNALTKSMGDLVHYEPKNAIEKLRARSLEGRSSQTRRFPMDLKAFL